MAVHQCMKGRKEPLFIFDQQVITGSLPVPFPVSACPHHPTSQVLGLGFSGMKMGWRPRLQDIARRPTSILELTCACRLVDSSRLRLEAQKVALYWPKRFHQRPTSATEFKPEFLRIIIRNIYCIYMYHCVSVYMYICIYIYIHIYNVYKLLHYCRLLVLFSWKC